MEDRVYYNCTSCDEIKVLVPEGESHIGFCTNCGQMYKAEKTDVHEVLQLTPKTREEILEKAKLYDEKQDNGGKYQQILKVIFSLVDMMVSHKDKPDE